MERFTRKYDKPIPFDEDCTMYYAVPKNHTEAHVSINMANKLGRFEDIEEELGIEISVLIKLFKKLNSGSIYTDDDFKHGFVWNIDVEKHTLMISNLDSWQTESKTYNLCDYKKTWWLKKDKSE